MLDLDLEHPFADFRNFLYAVWKHLGLPDPTPVQYDIAYYMQHGPDRLIIEGYRGVGKSFIASAFVVWHWWWDPQLKAMAVSASKERGDAFSQFCLRLIREMPELKHLEPTPDQRRSLVAFDVRGATADHSPSMKSVGITGTLTGSRSDLIIADDIEVPKNSQTMQQREKLRELVKEFDAILKPLPGRRILYLGTPQIEDSLYNHLLERGYEMRVWPSRKPSEKQMANYRGKLAPMVIAMNIAAGKPTDPKRFDDEDLTRRELSYGRSGFSLQFMLDTSLSDANKFPLKCADFIVSDVDVDVAPVKMSYGSSDDQQTGLQCVGMTGDRWYGPMYVSKEYAPYTDSVLYIDPAGRGDDRTAFVVLKYLNGMLFLKRAGSLEGGYSDLTLSALAQIAKTEKVHRVRVESNFGDGMYLQMLKPWLTRIHPCNTEEVRNTKQKELRIIDTLEPVLNQHRLIVDRAIVTNDQLLDPEHQLFYQLTRVTKERNSLGHDDLLDALGGGVASFAADLDGMYEDSEEKRKSELQDEALSAFMERVTGKAWNSENFLDRV